MIEIINQSAAQDTLRPARNVSEPLLASLASRAPHMSASKPTSARFGARQRSAVRLDGAYFRDPELGRDENDAEKYDKSRRRATVFPRHPKEIARVLAGIWRSRGARWLILIACTMFLLSGRSVAGSGARKEDDEPALGFIGQRVERRRAPSGTPSGAKLIPRVIHQTFKSRKALTVANKAAMETWRTMNPTWEIRFYDDDDCERFVRDHFPDYFSAYTSLEKKVEQSDFFRYLIVLKHGGVYADVDTECKQPLDELVNAKDTLIVGWENEFDSDAKAYSRHFVRRRQLLNWMFAGAPGHPALVEVAKHVNEGARKVFTEASNRNTLERTGPGAFTDAVMKHFESIRASGERTWPVRMMPKVYLGTHPLNEEGVSQNHPEVVVAHKYSGGWKHKAGWHGKRSWLDHLAILYHSIMNDLPAYREKMASRDDTFQMPSVDPERSYPVSVMWSPPFDLLTPLVGTMDAGSDIEDQGAEGYWLTLYGRPKVVTQRPLRVGENPAEILFDNLERSSDKSAVFVDIGAGLGYYSNAAASNGDKVYAYEWNDKLLANLKGSVEYNNFNNKITISNQIDALTSGEEFKKLLDLHAKVDAVRVGSRVFDSNIFKGLKSLLEGDNPPKVFLFETRSVLVKTLMRHTTEDMIQMFEYLWEKGYTDVGHVGPACDGRGVRKVKSLPSGRASTFDGTTWCRIDGSSFKGVLKAMHERYFETIVMFHTHTSEVA